MVLADGRVVLPAAGPFSCTSVVGVGWQVLLQVPFCSGSPSCWPFCQLGPVVCYWSACLGCGGVVGLGGHPCCEGVVSWSIKKGCPFTRTAIGLVF